MLLKNHALDLKFRYGIDKQEEIKSDNVDQNTFLEKKKNFKVKIKRLMEQKNT